MCGQNTEGQKDGRKRRKKDVSCGRNKDSEFCGAMGIRPGRYGVWIPAGGKDFFSSANCLH